MKKTLVDLVKHPLGLVMAFSMSVGAQAADLSRLQTELANAAPGSWVKVSLGSFSAAWPTGSVAVPNTGIYAALNFPGQIVQAWSSFAWDSTRGDLLLFGGGHANYLGNEIYRWHASTGTWSLGSLPSKVVGSSFLVPDNSAPQSAHTYDNNLYLPQLDRFLTLGGATHPTGGRFVGPDGVTGPWMWDPAKASSTLVGGSDGSGYDPSSLGGNMWENRNGPWKSANQPAHIQGTSANRIENGQDVVYLTADSNQSGFARLYRYTPGQASDGSQDIWEQVGNNSSAVVAFDGAGTLDNTNNLYIRTAFPTGSRPYDLLVWDLDGVSDSNRSDAIGITLKLADGQDFVLNEDFGLDFNSADGFIYAWDGRVGGSVFSFSASYTDGVLDSVWTVNELTPSTAAAPNGQFVTGVFGKWKYIPELNAFMALDEFSHQTQDAAVWLYKPFANAVPEPATYGLMLAGLLAVGGLARRRLTT